MGGRNEVSYGDIRTEAIHDSIVEAMDRAEIKLIRKYSEKLKETEYLE